MRVALTSKVAFFLLVASVLGARGADLPAGPVLFPASVPAPARSPWTTIYLGGFVGGSAATQSVNEQGANQFFAAQGAGTSALAVPAADPETPFQFSGSSGSFTAGGFAGAGYQVNDLVFGAEADYGWKNAQSNGAQPAGENAAYSYTPFNCSRGTGDCTYDTASAARTEAFSGQVRQNWDASVRLRLGALVTPAILVYATGGGAVGQVNSSFSYSATTVYNYENALGAPGPIAQTTSGSGNWADLRIGWTLGVGFEVLLSNNWRVRAEYRYTDLGSFDKQVALVRSSSDSLNLPNTGSAYSTVNFDAAFHTARIGLAYGF